MTPLASLTVLFLALAAAVSQVRLECTEGRILMSACHGITVEAFLLFESYRTVLECRCGSPTSWTVSPDGLQDSGVRLNTSSNEFSLANGSSLNIALTNITGVYGGLYRCVCGTALSDMLCIYVYARPVFASCPHELDGCTEEVSLSVTAGESVVFNSTVVYTPGGSCDFRQEVTEIRLSKRISETENVLLYSCETNSQEACQTQPDRRVSLDRGSGASLNFIFTLSDTIHSNDSGRYDVIVYKNDPRVQSGSFTTITKTFLVHVNPAPTYTPITTTHPPPSAEDTTTTTTGEGNSAGSSGGGAGGVIAVAVLVPLLFIVLIVFGVVFLVVKWQQIADATYRQWSKAGGDKLPGEGQKVNRTDAANQVYDRENTLPKNDGRVNAKVEDVRLPPENPRVSFIEGTMHELPSRIEIKLNRMDDSEKCQDFYDRYHQVQSQDVPV